MMIKIVCTKCKTEGSISLIDLIYEGVYRCWKCREPFMMRIADNEVKSLQPISQEEFDRQREIEALKAKFKQ